MYKVVGMDEKDVWMAERFVDALKLFYEHCIQSLNNGQKPSHPDSTCYIEAMGDTATARMSYPFIFEYAVKAGLIKDGKLAELLIEPLTTDLIAAFSRAAVLQMVGTLGCH
jgi:hypothetical protein